MIDLVLSFATLMGFAALVLLAVVSVTLIPAMLTADRAEERGLDPTLWGAISWAASGAALLVAYALHEQGYLWLLPLPLTYAGFGAVHRFGRAGAKVPGAHR